MSASSTLVHGFPSLTESEFAAGSQTLISALNRLAAGTGPDEQWEFVQAAPSFLKIKKAVSLPEHITCEPGVLNHGIELEQDLEAAEEEDEAELQKLPTQLRQAWLEFNIFLSPVYRTPVLYICAKDPVSSSLEGIDMLYDHVVSKDFKSQMDGVGVIGAISVANHPVNGIPVFFVHPCYTTEALTQLAQGEYPSPVRYLLLWFGLIGASVDLHIPSGIIQELNRMECRQDPDTLGSR